jgi:hypothetical protein
LDIQLVGDTSLECFQLKQDVDSAELRRDGSFQLRDLLFHKYHLFDLAPVPEDGASHIALLT